MPTFDEIIDQIESSSPKKSEFGFSQVPAFSVPVDSGNVDVEAPAPASRIDQIFDLLDENVPAKGKANIPKFEAVPEENPIARAASAVRESLSPIIGKSSETIEAEKVPITDAKGNVSYGYSPFSTRLEREGLFAPPVPTEDVIKGMPFLAPQEGDSGLVSGLRGLGRGTVGVLNSLQSPIGAPLLLSGGAEAAALKSAARGVPTQAASAILESPISGLNRAGAGLFAGAMAPTIPEQVQALGESQNAGEAVERAIGLGATGLGVVGGGAIALRPHKIAQAKVALDAGMPATAAVLAKQGVEDLSKTRSETPVSPEVAQAAEPAISPASEVPAPAVSEAVPNEAHPAQDLIAERNRLVIEELPKQGIGTNGEAWVQNQIARLDEQIQKAQGPLLIPAEGEASNLKVTPNEPAIPIVEQVSDTAVTQEAQAAPEAQTQEVINETIIPPNAENVPTGIGEVLGQSEGTPIETAEGGSVSQAHRETPLTPTDSIRDTIDSKPIPDNEISGILQGQLDFFRDNARFKTLNEEQAKGARGVLVSGVTKDISDALATTLGKDIVFVGGLPKDAPSGFYFKNSKPNTIFLNADGKYPLLFVAGHEFGHSVKRLDPEIYGKLQDYVLTNAKDWSKYREGLKDKGYSEEKMADEFTEDFIGNHFNEKEIWGEMSKKDPNLFQKILTHAIQYLDSLIGRASSMSRDVRPYFEDWATHRQELARMLNDHIQKNQPKEQNANTKETSEGNALHQIDVQPSPNEQVVAESAIRSEEGVPNAVEGAQEGVLAHLEKPELNPADNIADRDPFTPYQKGDKWYVPFLDKADRDKGYVSIHETKADADAAVTENRRDAQRAEENLRREAALKEKRAELEAKQQEKESPLNEYLDSENLTPMTKGKLKVTLSTPVAKRTANKIYQGTRFEVVQQMVDDGYAPKTEEVPAIKELTGQQYNRMDQKAQDAYDKKRKAAGAKTEYHLENPAGSFFVVTKAEFDAATHLSEKKSAIESTPQEGVLEQPLVNENPEFPNLGPGAANIREFGPVRTTSTMNRVADAERMERGDEPILKEAIRTNQETFDAAEAMVEADPTIGRKLVVSLNNGTKSSVSAVEEGILLYEKVRLQNERDMEADNASDPYASEESRNEARTRWEELEDQINDLDRATRRSGSEWGRMGQFRQRLLRSDFTFEAMERRARVAKGEPLTPEESAKIKAESETISKKQAEEDAARIRAKAKEREDALNDTIKRLKVEAAGVPKFSAKVLSIAESIASRLDREADAARVRIRERLANASAGVDPTVVYDLAVIGASKLTRATLDFGKWSASMISEFGDQVRPYLDEAWVKSNELLDAEDKRVSEPLRKPVKKLRQKNATDDERIQRIRNGIKIRVDAGQGYSSLVGLVESLAKAVARKGIWDREKIVDAVHEVLQSVIPEISRETTGDLIGKYGEFRPLDKDPAMQAYRAARGELREIGKYRDMMAGNPPKRTGGERQVPSAEERRLTKINNDLKKKAGYEVTDPETQLKTFKEGRRTRMRNEIVDLEVAIATKEPLPENKSRVEYDAEDLALKERLDALRKEYDETFPKAPLTDEEYLARTSANLDRSIANLEKDLKDGVIYPGSKRKLTSDEIENKRARLAALREERQLLRDLDTAVVEQKKEAALEKAIAEASAALPEKVSGVDTVDTKRVAELKTKLEEIREARANSPEAIQKKVDSAIESVENSIKELDRRLQEGDFSKTRTTEPISTPELDALRAERAAMQKLYSELKRASEPRKTPEEIELASLEKRKSDLEARIKSADTSTKGGKFKVDTKEIAALKDEVKALNKQMAELRRFERFGPPKTREQIALQAFKTRTANRIADLQDKIAREDFAKTERKPLQLDEEGKKASYELFKMKQEFAKALYRYEQSKRGPIRKVLEGVRDTLNASRSLITSFDLSGVLNQGGLLALGNPIRAAKALPKMFRAAFSAKKQKEINEEIASRPNAELYGRSKLAIVDPDSPILSKKEEAYMSNLLDKLTPSERKGILGTAIRGAQKTFNVATAPVRASERAYVTFLNLLRADSFDAMVDGLRDSSGHIDPAEAEAVANFVNVATGRGNVASGTAGVNLNAAFFSPRLLVSRFEYLLGAPLLKGNRRTRALIAKEYAKFFVAAGVAYSLAQLAGAEIELDPRSSDFMKIRIGNTRLDPLGGLAQATTFLSRLASGETKTISGKVIPLRRTAEKKLSPISGDAASVAGRFLRSKLNPALGTLINLSAGSDPIGQYFGPKEAIKAQTIPLSFGDIADAIKEQGPYAGSALALLNLFGLRMQTFKTEKEAAQQDAAITR